MLLWVAKDNSPTCRFYEALGGEPVGHRTLAVGGVDLEEVLYGWKDVSVLVLG